LPELESLTEELRDRFGPLPEPALQFISLKELELLAYGWGIQGIRLEEERFAVLNYTNDQQIHDLVGRYGRGLRIVDRRNAYLDLPKKGLQGPKLVDFLKSVLRQFAVSR
jgi:transcription-repair coupling factor (superfamily II helicase)